MSVDIYTKGFSDPIKWTNATSLINIFDPKDLDDAILRHSTTGSTCTIVQTPGGGKEPFERWHSPLL